MDLQRFSAFCDGDAGGNPAGVVIATALPDAAAMQALAAEVGYSETVFAAPEGEGWRVRYFSPEAEVDFCGHATIALGAALARRFGDGRFALQLNHAAISVEGDTRDGQLAAALQSPPTHSRAASPELLQQALALFGYTPDELDPRLPPAIAHAGIDHLVLALCSRAALAAMRYDLAAGRSLMQQYRIGTIALLQVEAPQQLHARNPFAIGGVYEDPATGAAAAAVAGYLRDLGWPHGGRIEILQGHDMGMPSRLLADIGATAGAGIRVSGRVRPLD